jgi:lipoteichoic acid synthase
MNFSEYLKIKLSSYYVLIGILVMLLFIIRVFEYSYFFHFNFFHFNFLLFLTYSLNFDIFFAIAFSVVCFPFYLFLSYKSNLANYFFKVLFIVIVILDWALCQYFLTNNEPLTRRFFSFSFQDIFLIIGAEFSMSRATFWIFFSLLFSLSVWLFFFISQKITINRITFWIVSIIFAFLIIVISINHRNYRKSIVHFDNKIQYALANNKMSLFIESCLTKQKNLIAGLNKIQIADKLSFFQKKRPDFHFLSLEYPLIHDEPYQNTLGELFIKSNVKPNIVIIIAESLGSFISGKESPIGSLTPFLDSLRYYGLSSFNFYSNSEYTYGALPAILGSLPYGDNDRGFINMKTLYSNGSIYPEHMSLLTLLKLKEYKTSFFYSCWGHFDNTDNFLKQNNIDFFFDYRSFKGDSLINGRKPGKDDFVWGFNDNVLFQQSFKLMDSIKLTQPYLNIYLTITLHSPFNMAFKQYYDRDYIRTRLLAMKKSTKIIDRIGLSITGSSIFFDDVLRDFFKAYSRRTDFDNTIFIIVGDHSLHIPDNRNMQVYHIAFIIYSKLLKKHASFYGMSSQLDITPSIIGLLQNNFNMSFPSCKQWIGSSIDTSSKFVCNKLIPMTIKQPDLVQIVYKNYFLSSNNVYRINPDFSETVVKSNDTIQLMKKISNSYEVLNDYVLQFDKIFSPCK